MIVTQLLNNNTFSICNGKGEDIVAIFDSIDADSKCQGFSNDK